MGDRTNLLVGPGTLYIASKGTAGPDENNNILVWPAPWVNLGFTDGGVEMEYEPTVTKHFVDQLKSPAKLSLDEESFVVRAPLAEATLGNLRYAISASKFSTVAAAGGVTGKDIVTVGGGELVEYTIGFEGESPESQADGTQGWRLVLVHIVVSFAAIAHSYKKGEKTLFPVEFQGLADDTKPVGDDLIRAVDWTAAAT
ncbi:hypothetical protein LCGC14_1637910 [marine sediment metagenome]|uniref:Major tail protein n=1 Tax=marine sediment metagenome TaxID=412755 RepID=A0A0F9KGC7_9ZZZZ